MLLFVKFIAIHSCHVLLIRFELSFSFESEPMALILALAAPWRCCSTCFSSMLKTTLFESCWNATSFLVTLSILIEAKDWKLRLRTVTSDESSNSLVTQFSFPVIIENNLPCTLNSENYVQTYLIAKTEFLRRDPSVFVANSTIIFILYSLLESKYTMSTARIW